jgi:two-component system sensor histidine kinase YesM
VFNKNGDFFTSNVNVQSITDFSRVSYNDISWLSQVDAASGGLVVLVPYADPWALSSKQKVFSVARSVQGPRGQMGYIEVQNKYEELEKIFSLPHEENLAVVAVTSSGQVFYNSGVTDVEKLQYYSDLAAESEEKVFQKKNPVSGLNEIVSCKKSSYSGVKFILVVDRFTLLKPVMVTGYITALIGLLIIIISLIYIYIFSRQLTKPIMQLKKTMENIDLENLTEKIVIKSSNNEIEALNKSFKLLRKRLNEAVQREINSQSLQMQANFDSLQAQVNPHFIYNILNVLSNRGFENGDEEICEICSAIAAMLRYSTSTLQRSATIKEELEHVNNYLLLMKKRFEHKLEFKIDVDQSIYGEAIPKIVLQQIAENSINHGYQNIVKNMVIEVKGYISNGWWYIEINDNGEGFKTDIISELTEKMKQTRKKLLTSENISGFAIGGMGLINTYARLALFYGEDFVFKVENKNIEGAKVTIGSKIGLIVGGIRDENSSDRG